eukprot:752029-Hanusia_phi.AAC.1
MALRSNDCDEGVRRNNFAFLPFCLLLLAARSIFDASSWVVFVTFHIVQVIPVDLRVLHKIGTNYASISS